MNKLISVIGLITLFATTGCAINGTVDVHGPSYNTMDGKLVQTPGQPCWVRGYDTPYQSTCPGQPALYEPSHPVVYNTGFGNTPMR